MSERDDIINTNKKTKNIQKDNEVSSQNSNIISEDGKEREFGFGRLVTSVNEVTCP